MLAPQLVGYGLDLRPRFFMFVFIRTANSPSLEFRTEFRTKVGWKAEISVEPWGFEPQIQPCHGRVIPFHYGPGIKHSAAAAISPPRAEYFIPPPRGVKQSGKRAEREWALAYPRGGD